MQLSAFNNSTVTLDACENSNPLLATAAAAIYAAWQQGQHAALPDHIDAAAGAARFAGRAWNYLMRALPLPRATAQGSGARFVLDANKRPGCHKVANFDSAFCDDVLANSEVQSLVTFMESHLAAGDMYNFLAFDDPDGTKIYGQDERGFNLDSHGRDALRKLLSYHKTLLEAVDAPPTEPRHPWTLRLVNRNGRPAEKPHHDTFDRQSITYVKLSGYAPGEGDLVLESGNRMCPVNSPTRVASNAHADKLRAFTQVGRMMLINSHVHHITPVANPAHERLVAMVGKSCLRFDNLEAQRAQLDALSTPLL